MTCLSVFLGHLLRVYVALGAASIVEPHGFSGSLPVMIFFMCCKLCEFIQANKDVLFCSNKPGKNVRPSVRSSTIKLNAATNQLTK